MTRERRDRGGIALLHARSRAFGLTKTEASRDRNPGHDRGGSPGLRLHELVERGFLRYNSGTGACRYAEGGPAGPGPRADGYDGSPLRALTLWTMKPLVLVFGSCT